LWSYLALYFVKSSLWYSRYSAGYLQFDGLLKRLWNKRGTKGIKRTTSNTYLDGENKTNRTQA
jgi:hypothetical protein